MCTVIPPSPAGCCMSSRCWDVTDVIRDGETDVRVHERLVHGDDDALAEVYDRWATLVFSIAFRITGDHGAAEDVTQEVFVHLWEHPEKFDPNRGALRTWLAVVARGRALDWVRRSQTRARYHAAAAVPERDQADVAETVLWQTEAKVVREAVQALPDKQRDAL